MRIRVKSIRKKINEKLSLEKIMIFALKMNKGFSLEKEISIRYLLFIFF